jgi:hypothetical protein
MQLISSNFAGNIHSVCSAMNSIGLAEFVISMDFTGNNTIVVFRVPDGIVARSLSAAEKS